MSSPGSDANSETSDTTDVSDDGRVGFDQADVDAAMALLEMRRIPQAESEDDERWNSNVPAAVQAVQAGGVVVDAMRWGSSVVRQRENVDGESPSAVLLPPTGVMPERAAQSCKAALKKRKQSGDAAEPPSAIHQPVSPLDQEATAQRTSPNVAPGKAGPHQSTPFNAPVQAALYHPALNEDDAYQGPIPTASNVAISLYTCGHVSVAFHPINHGPVLGLREGTCARIPCQTTYPPHSPDRLQAGITLEAKTADLHQYRAELSAINAIISQAVSRLEFSLTGALEPGLWVKGTRESVVRRACKLPVIAGLLGVAQTHYDRLFVHAALQAARLLLEEAQWPFRHFSNWVDDMCEGVEQHLTVGRFTAAEIDRLGAMRPFGFDSVDNAGR